MLDRSNFYAICKMRKTMKSIVTSLGIAGGVVSARERNGMGERQILMQNMQIRQL